MKEIVLVIAASFLSALIAFVLDGGSPPRWRVEKQAYDKAMLEIVARQPGGILSDFEAR